MKKVIDYKIVYIFQRGILLEKVEEMEKKVKELVAKGWQPQGGIYMDETSAFYQAMVLYEEL